ncbi:type II toxin-antitoxin system RelE family toxin (plasmid) [Enterococcus sp. 22-H-5-01]|uniref:type II toxin-antitoxin system RelE family toxin n=1 Tax=Enterococcus sp. 22-H-5-01 TaxID=3418555 RepID=UPI003D034F30
MTYKVELTKDVLKQLRKMDKHQATLLTRWLYQNIDGTNNPRSHGKGLVGNRSGQWRYRVGNYRIIVEIEDERLLVTAIQVGHRKNIYDN